VSYLLSVKLVVSELILNGTDQRAYPVKLEEDERK
jgi:hypothetical protein